MPWGRCATFIMRSSLGRRAHIQKIQYRDNVEMNVTVTTLSAVSRCQRFNTYDIIQVHTVDIIYTYVCTYTHLCCSRAIQSFFFGRGVNAGKTINNTSHRSSQRDDHPQRALHFMRYSSWIFGYCCACFVTENNGGRFRIP